MKIKTKSLLKFKKLKRRFGMPDWQVVGLLESLWLGTTENAPQGDIGKYSNEDIAAIIEWDGDADELVNALVEYGWLDESDEHRLVVHDWHEHAPNYLKGNLAKHGKEFVTEFSAESSNLPSSLLSNVPSNLPSNVPSKTGGQDEKPQGTEESENSDLLSSVPSNLPSNVPSSLLKSSLPGRVPSSQVKSSQVKSSQVIAAAYEAELRITSIDPDEVMRLANGIAKVLRPGPGERDFVWQTAILAAEVYSEDWLRKALEKAPQARRSRVAYFRTCCQENAARHHRDFEEDLKRIPKQHRRAPPKSEGEPSGSAALGDRFRVAESSRARAKVRRA